MNRIEWKPKAAKQLRKLDRQHQVIIRDAVTGLSAFPDCRNVKALQKHTHAYRLRVGQYRVFFEFAGEIKVITIEEVKKRDERTY
ncbi:MAG TPA: type II toxin-antitoxin system RelE/ParE family toxin [Gammaproteobacteria bacterium]|nr:type II toxin-antitoxin system RelE/ParE family toxin [Gammaproteobacteria bacterium]